MRRVVPYSCQCIGKDSRVACINAIALLFGKGEAVLTFDSTGRPCRSGRDEGVSSVTAVVLELGPIAKDDDP